MRDILLNGRFHGHQPTGMQRYAIELAKRFGGRIDSAYPRRPLFGAVGHAWEQFYLPGAARGKLLWSPNNTGPVSVAAQVCTFHDLIPLDRPEWFNARFAAWYGWLLPRLARRVQHIIAVSHFTKTRIVDRFGLAPENVTVVENGVDERFAPRSSAEIAAVRKTLQIDSPHYILCVGSVEPRKNTSRLVQAWAQIQHRLPREISLVIAGPKGKSLVFSDVSFEQLPPRVQLTGYVADEQLPALYSGALAMVYPSLYEGFGLPLIEAMACGTPVVTSNTTSLPEVAGDAALLVDPLDVQSIADGIERLVESSSLQERLRVEGQERAKHFTWERTAEQTWRVLQSQACY
jgi:glycosyltransferase involved in cell wall biosynthesis